jgi:hypothetical protein
MSYSRWSYSVWYSFWSANGAETKEEQIMSLWYSLDKTTDWTYSDLLNVAVEDIHRHYSCDIEDAQEAMTYINMFIKDVDMEFKEVVK